MAPKPKAEVTRKLSFDANVPTWLRRMVRREVEVLHMQDWTVEVHIQTQAEMQVEGGSRDEYAGAANCLPVYRKVHLYFVADLKDSPQALDTVRHELNHGRLSAFRHFLDYAFAQGLNHQQAAAYFDDLIETHNESDVDIWADLLPHPRS